MGTALADGIELLADIRRIFDAAKDDRLTSHVLVDELNKLEDRPWPDFKRGQPITAPVVARLLKPFEIKPRVVRIGTATPRGYDLMQFIDAFARYLPPSEPKHRNK